MNKQILVKHISKGIQKLKISDCIQPRPYSQLTDGRVCERNSKLVREYRTLPENIGGDVMSLSAIVHKSLCLDVQQTTKSQYHPTFSDFTTFNKWDAKDFTETNDNPCNRYILPSLNHIVQEKIAILDPFHDMLKMYDLPTLTKIEKVDPKAAEDSQVGIIGDKTKQIPVKKAKNVLKIRRRKMRHHKYKKWKKKYKFDIRRYKMKRRKLYEAKLAQELADLRSRGEKFDAMKYIEEDLAKARQHGYKLDIFKSRPEKC